MSGSKKIKPNAGKGPGKSLPGSLFNRYWMALALVVLTFVVYGNSLQNQFVFDDHFLIVNNSALGNWSDLGKVFISNYQPGQNIDVSTNYYRPIVMLSLGIDKMVWGLRPFGFHLTNILLMALLAVSINALLLDLFAEEKISLLAVLLYLVNPIHTESVSFISGRTDLLATLMMVAALLFYVRWRETGKQTVLMLSLAAWLAALGSKESALVFPVILLGMELITGKNGEARIRRREYLYYLAVLAIFLIARYLVLRHNSYWREDVIDVSSVGTVFQKNWRYLKLILWPSRLSTYYTDVFKAGLSGWISSLLLLTVPAILIYLSRKREGMIIAFSGVLFLWGSLPAMGLVRNSSGVEFGERFVFFSSLGIALLMAWAFVRLTEGTRQGAWKYGAIALLAIYGSFLGYKTVRQNRVWVNDQTLFKEMARTSPQSYLAQYNLANEYAKRRQADSAVVHYQKAIEIKPTNIDAINNLGVLFFMMGKYALAEGEYRKAVVLNPRSPVVYYNIGLCYQQRGLAQDASHWYRLALEKDPFFRPAGSALELIENDDTKGKK